MDKPIYTFLAGPDCFYPDFEEVKALSRLPHQKLVEATLGEME